MGNLTIRSRLTLWWGGLFLLFGLLLVAVINTVVLLTLTGPVGDGLVGELGLHDDTLELVTRSSRTAVARIRTTTLVTLIVLAAAAGATGWWLSGRMLAPIRKITETARSISERNLRERIAAHGPKDELHELADAFDAMLERLERSFDAQRAFTADASHELRTPLTLIRAEVDVTLADPHAGSDELTDATTSIRHALIQSELLIDRLLELANAETLRDHHPVELGALLQRSLGTYVDTDDLEVHAALVPAEAHGDAMLLQRLVDNLVHNAVRHNQANGWIRVATNRSQDRVGLRVSNSGPHLTEAQVNRLTERFYRPDPSRTRASGGSGLGLAIVATIVRAHHGTLAIERRATGGLDIEVAFPQEARLAVPGRDSRP